MRKTLLPLGLLALIVTSCLATDTQPPHNQTPSATLTAKQEKTNTNSLAKLVGCSIINSLTHVVVSYMVLAVMNYYYYNYKDDGVKEFNNNIIFLLSVVSPLIATCLILPISYALFKSFSHSTKPSSPEHTTKHFSWSILILCLISNLIAVVVFHQLFWKFDERKGYFRATVPHWKNFNFSIIKSFTSEMCGREVMIKTSCLSPLISTLASCILFKCFALKKPTTLPQQHKEANTSPSLTSP